jgi:thioredoxin 1
MAGIARALKDASVAKVVGATHAGASSLEETMGEQITTLTDATFDEVIGSSEKPILVDFWAEWCGPCKMIAPILEEFATEQSERFTIGKLDVDANVATATKFSVMSIPTLLLFKDGEVVARLVGAKPKGALLQEISANL